MIRLDLPLTALHEGHSVRSYHNEAIRAAQLAMAALHQGDRETHKQFMRHAMSYETNAADLAPDEKSAEPTRSILYRSAASFAYQADEPQEAERLILKGLSGHPPVFIKRQLLEIRELLQTNLLSNNQGKKRTMTEERKYPEWMGKMRGLTPAEIAEFLAGPIVARVASIDEEGMPYITPVWQEWDGEAMWIVPRERSVWVKQIQHNPNLAVSCALDTSPYTRVLMRGKAEIVEGPVPMSGKCLEVANRMAVRYLGERGPEYLVPTYDRARYLIKFTPSKIVSWEGVEWHEKYTK